MTVSLKEGAIVVVTEDDGSVPSAIQSASGLYYHDTRFLSVFELRVNRRRPLLLSANTDENWVATFQLVNPALDIGDGQVLPAQSLSIRRTRFISDGLRERIGVMNCSGQGVRIELALALDADFRDMFAVRGYQQQETPAVERRELADGVDIAARGGDGVLRETRVRSSPGPNAIVARELGGCELRFAKTLAAQEIFAVEVRVLPYEDGRAPRGVAARSFDRAVDLVRASYARFLRTSTRFSTSRERFDHELLQQSALDLRALLDFEPTGPFPTAGIPWYAAPFGRDAITASLQALCFHPDMAVGTLRLLAKHQGTKVDAFTEEEPGKIFHELRLGELARLGQVPHRPYYGSIDATPLFVCLFVEAVRWTGDWALYRELLPHALAALEWCDRYGDVDGDGFIEYAEGSAVGLRNKGWKDSAMSLSYRDCSLAELPAALVEVQAYAYRAKHGLAELAALAGDEERAARLRGEAAALRERFEDAFWMPDENCYAQALDAKKRRIDAVTSNAGHALWGGVASPERAALLTERLLGRDMFSGWGVRTLSSSYPTYNPMSYHNGSVWPHDNSLVAAGMAAYGHREAANRIITAMVEAGLRFPNGRLPEVFCGFPRDERFSSRPADYVVACIPQAWSAATTFLFLQTMLGLVPDIGAGRLRIEPVLPDWLERVDVRGLLALGRRHTFRVRRTSRGVRVSGDLSGRAAARAGKEQGRAASAAG